MKKLLLGVLGLISTSLFAQSWVQQGNFPAGRHHPISFTLNGKGYAITGTSNTNQPTKSSFQYDPASDTWTTLADFPGLARSYGIGTVVNGKAYLGFGANANQEFNDFWSLDTNGSWTQLTSCGCSGRRHPAMIAANNKIYVGLGDDASGNLRDFWEYDIPSDSWSQMPNLPAPPRHHPFMFNAGGEVFAGMGHGNNGVIFRDWYKLDTATNFWSIMQLFPGEGRVAGTQFSMGNYGFVLSGDGDDHSFMATGEMWRYDPTADSWTQFPPHPGLSRWAPGSFVINDSVYFFGGLNRSNGSFPTSMWKFDMAAATMGLAKESASKTLVYPNPANHYIKWESDLSFTEVKVFDAVGQLVFSVTGEANHINTQAWNNGLYLIQFYSHHEVAKTAKVLIRH